MTTETETQTAYSFPLDGREIYLGRDVSCDVRISGLAVSRRHAVIKCSNPPRIIDNKSSYGTKIGSDFITDAPLVNGAAITIGIHIMQVYIEDEHLCLTLLNPAGDETMQGESKETITIGRDGENDICLPHPLVSRFHAVIKQAKNQLTITDLGSANATYINGCPISSTTLCEGDTIHIGPFRFFVKDGKICKSDDTAAVSKLNKIKIEAHSVDLNIKGKKLLDDVNLTIEAGAFVALLGASGAGKSLLSKVLSGQLSPTSGRLFMNGFPASRFGAAFARGIGYVSQKILLRGELTVWETLSDQSLVRLPSDSSEKERLARTNEVLELIGLAQARHRRVSDLSGGEARRLHVGVELLASPAAIILDEPLAGLDPGLTQKFMKLFRRICDKGHTLILITHTLEHIEFCDKLAYIKSGRVEFYGKPNEICEHFNVQTIAQVYDCAAAKDPQNNDAAKKIAGAKSQKRHLPHAHGLPHAGRFSTLRHPLKFLQFFWRQVRALNSRYSKIYLRDKRNIALLMAQTPLITILLSLVYGAETLQFSTSFYFCLTIIGIWVGGLDSVREVATELPLVSRETKCGMGRFAYVTARITTAATLSFTQAFLFIIFLVLTFKNLDFSMELLTLLFMAIFSGNVLGLVISVASGSVSRALAALPIVLIPQIFFSGAVVPFERMTFLGQLLARLTIAHPIFSMMKKTHLLSSPLASLGEWLDLFLLTGALSIIFGVLLVCRTGKWSVSQENV